MENMHAETYMLTTLSSQMADAVERIGTALVMVNGRQRQPASGIVYAANLVLTADHVLEREEDLTIQTHDDRTLAAQFVGRDPSTDLAVLRVNDLGLDAAQAASDPARVGQLTLAVGRPSPAGPMASLGIVSAVGGPVRMRRGRLLEQYIRTDAIPYPGFSGGPLIDGAGAVLGVLTTGLVGGATLAIPASIAWRIGDTLSQQGFVRRGYLGISSQPVHLPENQRAGRNQERGLLIIRVEPDSPAQASGLLLGDILVSLDGVQIDDTDDLQSLLMNDRVGATIAVEVIRGGALQTLKVTVGQRTGDTR